MKNVTDNHVIDNHRINQTAAMPVDIDGLWSLPMGRKADTSKYTQNEIDLWGKIIANQDTVFHTAKGLEFRIRVVGNELFVDRKEKSITRASVNIAYGRWIEDRNCGPKALGVFGASYLWGVFREVDEQSV